MLDGALIFSLPPSDTLFRAPRTPGRAFSHPLPARILWPFPDAELPGTKAPRVPPERGAVPPWFPQSSRRILPARRKSVSGSLFRPLPLRPSQSPRQLPVPCQPALPRYPPAAACPASRPHLPLREVSGAPHLLSAFPVSSPSRCRCLETLAGLQNFPPTLPCSRSPVNPRLSAPAPFIMPGLPLQDPAPRLSEN